MATHELVGLTIEEVVPLEHDIMVAEGWDADNGDRPAMLILSDGTKVYPASCPKGETMGALFGVRPEGEHVHYPVQDKEDADGG